MAGWYVSRQCYWPEGDLVVEICSGGLEHSNPDMLCDKYPELGEGKEYDDPRDAVKAAIAIQDAWNADLTDGEQCRIEHGDTGGYTMPFCEEPTKEEVIEWGEKEYESLDKCAYCDEPLSSKQNERWEYYLIGENQDQFCSEECVDKGYPF